MIQERISSVSLWRWYINITLTILDIINGPVFYWKHYISDTAFCLGLQIEPTRMGHVGRASLSLRRLSKFHLKTETGFWLW
jgi:hypothetical protein